MICMSPLDGLVRAPRSVIPKTAREAASEPTDILEAACSTAMAEFVNHKHALETIKASLETGISHLKEAAQGSRDVRVAVMSINMDLLSSQLHLFDERLSSRDCLEKLRRVCQQIQCLRQGSFTLRLVHGVESGVCLLPSTSVERVRTLLQPRGQKATTMWRGQWAAIQSLTADIFRTVLPEFFFAIWACLDDGVCIQNEILANVARLETMCRAATAPMEDAMKQVQELSTLLLEQLQGPAGVPVEVALLLTPKSHRYLDNILMEERESIFNTEMN